MENIKVLIVDDDPDIINAISMILKNRNYNVVTAGNRAEGIKAAKAEKPDLIILDVMMDTISAGFDMARDVRNDENIKHLPIIMLTAIDDKTGVNFKSAFGNTEMLPVDAYIEKPVAPHILLSEIDNLLNKKD